MKLEDRFRPQTTERRKNIISVYLDDTLLSTLDRSVQQWGLSRNEAIIRILQSFFDHAGVKWSSHLYEEKITPV